jgi:hypothetical protein
MRCATAIVTAVAARAPAVWDADDPEAVALWRAGVLSPRRSGDGATTNTG